MAGESQSAGVGSALPDQTDNDGYVLTTNGVTASWESGSAASLPSQATHSGEFLTTDGSDASWAAVTAETLLPNQATHSGDVLSTDGAGALSWIAASGVSLAAVGSTPNADGATLAANTLNLEPADATHPGVVTTGTQTLAGAKTLTGGVISDVGIKGVTAGQSNFALTSESGYALVALGANANTPTTGVAALLDVSGDTRVNTATAHNIEFSVQGTPYWKVLGANGYIAGQLDGIGFKLKSPDGTVYTVTIANGGTWSIV